MQFALTVFKNRIASVSVSVAVAVALLTAMLPLPAVVDVWGDSDAKGVAHLSTEKSDKRYDPFFKGGDSVLTGIGLPGRHNRLPTLFAQMPVGQPSLLDQPQFTTF